MAPLFRSACAPKKMRMCSRHCNLTTQTPKSIVPFGPLHSSSLLSSPSSSSTSSRCGQITRNDYLLKCNNSNNEFCEDASRLRLISDIDCNRNGYKFAISSPSSSSSSSLPSTASVLSIFSKSKSFTQSAMKARRRAGRSNVSKTFEKRTSSRNSICRNWLVIMIVALCLISSAQAFDDDDGEEVRGNSQPPIFAEDADDMFQVTDQQAFLGKLFYYRLRQVPNMRNVTLSQAGLVAHVHSSTSSSSSSSSSPLPAWLHFDPKTGELFGAPLEKRIYFIQVSGVISDHQAPDHHNHNQNPQSSTIEKRYDDIFVIEVIDPPGSLFLPPPSRKAPTDSSGKDLVLHQCRIELKNSFFAIDDLRKTVFRLRRSSTVENEISTSHNNNNNNNDYDDNNNQQQHYFNNNFHEWLQRFSVSPVNSPGAISAKNWEDGERPLLWKLLYQVEHCGSPVQSSHKSDHILLDSDSEKLLSRLSDLRIESELVKISSFTTEPPLSTLPSFVNFPDHRDRNDPERSASTVTPDEQLSEEDFENPLRSNHHHHNHHHHQHHNHHRNPHHDYHHQIGAYHRHHRRRNAYADDADSNPYATPTLQPDHHTILTTSTIDLNQDFILSRTLIPSMISPTFAGAAAPSSSPPNFIDTNGARPAQIDSRFRIYSKLYSTPVLLPDPYTLLNAAHDLDGKILATPVVPRPHQTSVSVHPSATFPSKSSEYPGGRIESSVVPETGEPKSKSDEASTTSTTSSTTTTTTTTTAKTTTESSAPTIKPNRRPFVNRRIAKLSITAGKYWQYTIPEHTFMDIENGNTRNLRLAFFKDSELPPIDYWIQFDHENQYLYALPTEENIGKYKFNLVAIDSHGAEVTETIEIYVRQPRETLTFTHRFIMANVTWHQDLFLERIQAVSTLLQRMAMQIFEESPSNDPNEAVQRQTILHAISVTSIIKNVDDSNWTIIWSNDTLRRHPCPVNDINRLFSKLYDVTYPEDAYGFMTPSHDLRNALSPEFKILKIKREFIGRSACGSYAIGTSGSSSLSAAGFPGSASAPGSSSSADATRHKDKAITFSNRLARLGPYKLGEAFRFQIPKDTVYSTLRQVDARDLTLSLAAVEPEIDLPEFLYFDVREQTIYGLPFKEEHVHSYELQLIAEDPIIGGREKDFFTIDIERDGNIRDDYLFEVTMSFLIRNVEKLSGAQLRLTPKDYYQVAAQIATKLMANSNLDALRMLNITRHRFSKISEEIIGDVVSRSDPGSFGVASLHSSADQAEDQSPEKAKIDGEEESPMFAPQPESQAYRNSRKRRRSSHSNNNNNNHKNHHKHHHHYYYGPNHNHNHQHPRQNSRFKRSSYDDASSISSIANMPGYFYEFVWANRSLVTSHFQTANANGGGTFFETESCPKNVIHRDVYDRLFPSSAAEFLAAIALERNISSAHMDVMEIYSRLFESIEANIEFLSVEWRPKSVCSIGYGLDHRIFGAKPIQDSDSDFDLTDAQPTQSQPDSGSISPPIEIDDDDLDLARPPTQTYMGDRLLTVIIPPIAIMIALLFAVTIGCCFHRANLRRKAMGAMQEMTEDDNPNLYRKRIPIQFEFERGGGGGGGPASAAMFATETEAMLGGHGRHPIQIMPMKRTMGGYSGSAGQPQLMQSGVGPQIHHHQQQQRRGLPSAPPPTHHMPYSMLPQQ